MSYYVKESISHEEAKSLPVGATYFKVYLLDEDSRERVEVVGRYTTIIKARKACCSYAKEELDGENGSFEIQIFQINEEGHPRIVEWWVY